MPFLSNRQISGLCLRLGTVLHAGLPLTEADKLIRFQGPEVGEIVKEITDRSCLGEKLHEILASTGRFPSYVTGLLETGDAAGRTEDALAALAAYYDKQARRERQVRSAVLYPAILLVLMLAIIAVLLIKVLPVFDSVYASLGASMTGVAGGLLRAGQVLERAMPVLLGLMAAALLAGVLFSVNDTFRTEVTSLFLEKFGDRGVCQKLNDAKVAQAMTMGLHSGMALDGAIELAANIVKDVPEAEKRCRDCADMLRTDAEQSWVLSNAGLLPQDACELLYLGQRSGQLDSVADQVAAQLSDDADHALDGLISRIEPAMVLVSALLVGLILIAVMLPLMDIMSSIA